MSSNSTTPLNRHTRNPPKDDAPPDTPFLPIIRLFSRRSTPSFSSSSTSSDSSRPSFSCSRDDSPLFTPSTPLWSSGIPFSWEKLPGIPKSHRQLSKKKNPSSSFSSSSLKNLLPLPPSAGTTPPVTPSKQKVQMIGSGSGTNQVRDPFFAALIECSKDDDDDQDSVGNNNIGNYWKGSKSITRSISDRLGFVGLYTSCKRNCSVSESIIYVPRSQG